MESTNSGGIGIIGALTLVFLVLKLVPGNPVNDWSWWWVFSPLWICFILWALFLGIAFLVLWIRGKL